MIDSISIARLQRLHPKVRSVFKSFIEECESTIPLLTLRITQGLRTFEEQKALYNSGRNGNPGKIVTNANAGQSFHNYGLAIDLVAMDGKTPNWNFDMAKLKPIANKYGIKWGGDFKKLLDKPHFELTFGYDWRALLVMPKDENGYVILSEPSSSRA